VKRVVERCPTCGVEHETLGDGTCEACGTPLRVWCRTHSREIGWLAGDECPRCPPAHAHVGPRGRAVAHAPAPEPAVSPAPPPSVDATRPAYRVTEPPPPPAAPVVSPAAPTPSPAAAETPAATEVEAPIEKPTRRVRREPAAQGPFVRLFNAVLSVLQGGITGVLVGVAAGGVQAVRVGADIPVTTVEWGVYGGMLGLLLGGLVALAALFRSPSGPR
jgi:hypothetical protein